MAGLKLLPAPWRPWASLSIAILTGPFLGCLLTGTTLAAILPADPDRPLARILWEGVYSAALGYNLVMPFVILYAAPLLWAAQRFQLARPGAALIAGALPGLVPFALIFDADVIGTLFPAWSFLAGSVCASVIFFLTAFVRRDGVR